MNAGIVFFLDGNAQAVLLSVAMYTLKQHYGGPVYVCFGPNTDPWLPQAVHSMGDSIGSLSQLAAGFRHRRQCWNSKPLVHQQSPFDVSIVFDLDHVFTREIDNKVFAFVEKHGLVPFHRPRKMKKPVAEIMAREFDSLDLLDVYDSCGGECVGSAKASYLIEEWKTNIRKAERSKTILRRFSDEFALSQIAAMRDIPKYQNTLTTRVRRRTRVVDDAVALHFAGSSWTTREEFYKALKETRAADFMQLDSMFEWHLQQSQHLRHMMNRRAPSLVQIIAQEFGATKALTGAEVGVWKGETSAILLQHFPNLVLHLVDCYELEEVDDSTMPVTPRQKRIAKKTCIQNTSFASDRICWHLTKSTSAAKAVANNSLDFVFIDACHAYESVKRDIEAWHPKLKLGGILCGHDYGPKPDSKGWGVTRAVDEWAAKNNLKVSTAPGYVWWAKLSLQPEDDAARLLKLKRKRFKL